MDAPGPFLDRNRFNLVGENHKLSDARRAQEQKFIQDKLPGLGYWTEGDFDSGDNVDLRALHKAVLLTIIFQDMAGQASEVLAELGPAALAWPAEAPDRLAGLPKNPARKDPAQMPGTMKGIGKAISQANQLDQAQAKFMQFSGEQLAEAIRDRYSIDHKRKLADSATDTAVQAVFDMVDSAFGQYFGSLYRAMQVLVGTSDALVGLVPPLSQAAIRFGEVPGSLEDLSLFLRRERSWRMYQAAATTTERGVWKVGDNHIKDLREHPEKIDPARVNILSTAEFDTLLGAGKPRRTLQRSPVERDLPPQPGRSPDKPGKGQSEDPNS
jgi:hypothetical protein